MRHSVLLLTLGSSLLACRTPVAQSGAPLRSERTPDGLVLDLPADYEKRNERCFGKNVPAGNDYFLLGQAEFCVSLIEGAKSPPRALLDDPAAATGRCHDCQTFRNRQVDSVLVGGRALHVERALLSGTIHHYTDKPAILIRVALAGGGGAVLIGEYESSYDAELIRIAATIRLR